MAHVPYRFELPPGTTSTRSMESGTRPQLIHPPKPSLSGTPSRSTSPRRLPSPCKPKSCAVGWLYRLLRRLGCMPGTARSRSSIWGPLRNGVASICSRVRTVGEPGAWRAGMGVRVAVTTISSSSESGGSGPAAWAVGAIASMPHQPPSRSHAHPIRDLLIAALMLGTLEPDCQPPGLPVSLACLSKIMENPFMHVTIQPDDE